jgi:hypothetical protein
VEVAGAAGLVAGGPTFVVPMVGFQVTSDALELLFFALAGGSSCTSSARSGPAYAARVTPSWASICSAAGFLIGIATDLVRRLRRRLKPFRFRSRRKRMIAACPAGACSSSPPTSATATWPPGLAVAEDLRRLGCDVELTDGLFAFGAVARHVIRDGYRVQMRVAPWS